MSAQRADPIAGLALIDAGSRAKHLACGARPAAGGAVTRGLAAERRRAGLAGGTAGGDLRVVGANPVAGVQPLTTSEATLRSITRSRPTLRSDTFGAGGTARARGRVVDAAAPAVMSSQRAHTFTGRVLGDTGRPAQLQPWRADGATADTVTRGSTAFRHRAGCARVTAAALIRIGDALIGALMRSIQTDERHGRQRAVRASRVCGPDRDARLERPHTFRRRALTWNTLEASITPQLNLALVEPARHEQGGDQAGVSGCDRGAFGRHGTEHPVSDSHPGCSDSDKYEGGETR
jgi:hypothetical protein